MKPITPALFAILLTMTACDDSAPPLKPTKPVIAATTLSIVDPRFDTPEHAIETLLAAYQSKDIEAIVAAKDFALDSRLFWENLGLPISDEQRTKSVAAFETNFRKQMTDNGIPDYRDMKHSITARERLQDNFVLITLACQWSDGRTNQLRLPAIKTGSQWKAALVPNYDHL